MNIVMLSNTYLPHVGGVARSVDAFARHYRELGHKVLVVAPEFENMPPNERHVLRIPALQKFNGSDFSVVLPVSGLLADVLDRFKPDIVHAHHPFLLGMTALRIARFRSLPLVFTHHTLYEQYTHYVPGDSPTMKRFAIELATRYANYADAVFAPSESVARMLRERGVRSSIEVVPTGVELARFSGGNGVRFRQHIGIPQDAFLVGHIGRLAPEKNLRFLAQSVARFINNDNETSYEPVHFLVVGTGPSEQEIHAIFARQGLSERLHTTGVLQHHSLADAYQAMHVFAFASTSETQGMVLTEAMAAGVPVVALDAPGAREVVLDKRNGRLLTEQSSSAFAAALQWVADQPSTSRNALQQCALATAEQFSMPCTAARALACYRNLISKTEAGGQEEDLQWNRLLNLIRAEWDIVEGVTGAASASISNHEPKS